MRLLKSGHRDRVGSRWIKPGLDHKIVLGQREVIMRNLQARLLVHKFAAKRENRGAQVRRKAPADRDAAAVEVIAHVARLQQHHRTSDWPTRQDELPAFDGYPPAAAQANVYTVHAAPARRRTLVDPQSLDLGVIHNYAPGRRSLAQVHLQAVP